MAPRERAASASRTSAWRVSLAAAVAAYILAASSGFSHDAENTNSQGDNTRKKCFDANATPVTIGANWLLTGGSPDAAASVDQVEVVKFEINNSCGVRVGAAKVGAPLAVLVRDNANIAAQSSAVTHELIGAGAVAVVGGGGSITALPAAQVAVESNIPFGANQAAADALSGCTAAELADPAVTKSATPMYGPGQCWDNHGLFFRTTGPGYQGGAVGARYARETYPALTTAAIVYRDDDFGRPNRDGFRDTFVGLGGTVLAEGGFSVNTATLADFKTLLRTVTAGNPSIIAANPNITRLKLLMRAYVELRDDPTWTAKPANFDRLTFVWTATVTTGTYGDLGAAALAALVNQSTSLEPAWDPNSVAFQKWFALYRAFNPDAQPPTSGFFMSAYDALIVTSLAITAAGTTDGPSVAAKLKEVTNPPGKCVYPGEWRKAFRFLAKGKDINYEGARGPVDLDERGNATGIAYGIFNFNPDGSTALVGTFGSAAQQSACEEDDEEDDEDD